MNIEVEHRWYAPELCEQNIDKLYVFGDNAARYGMGGQACIRKEMNAIGIATKINPGVYMSDSEYFKNIEIINNDIFNIRENYLNDMYNTIVFPAQGIGTGLSNMQQVCPRTFLYLCTRLLDEFNYNNLSNLKSK
jgi:hypothetical protein